MYNQDKETLQVHAFMLLTNWGGCEISINSSGDYVYFRRNFGSNNITTWSGPLEILYCDTKPYFEYEEEIYYIDQFIRSDI